MVHVHLLAEPAHLCLRVVPYFEIIILKRLIIMLMFYSCHVVLFQNVYQTLLFEVVLFS